MSETPRGGLRDLPAKSKTLLQILSFIVFILVVTVVMRFINYGGVSGDMSFDGTGVQIEIPDGTVYAFSYSEILDISLEAMPDELGTCVSGDQARALYCGIWENETWGTYVTYLNPTLSSVIVMEVPDQTIVVNFESDSSTESLYQAILNEKEAES